MKKTGENTTAAETRRGPKCSQSVRARPPHPARPAPAPGTRPRLGPCCEGKGKQSHSARGQPAGRRRTARRPEFRRFPGSGRTPAPAKPWKPAASARVGISVAVAIPFAKPLGGRPCNAATPTARKSRLRGARFCLPSQRFRAPSRGPGTVLLRKGPLPTATGIRSGGAWPAGWLRPSERKMAIYAPKPAAK